MIKKQTPTSHLSHFVNHLHDYKMNWTPLSPINITTKLYFWSRAKQGPSVRLHDHTYCQLQCTVKLIINELCTVKPVLYSTILSSHPVLSCWLSTAPNFFPLNYCNVHPHWAVLDTLYWHPMTFLFNLLSVLNHQFKWNHLNKTKNNLWSKISSLFISQ